MALTTLDFVRSECQLDRSRRIVLGRFFHRWCVARGNKKYPKARYSIGRQEGRVKVVGHRSPEVVIAELHRALTARPLAKSFNERRSRITGPVKRWLSLAVSSTKTGMMANGYDQYRQVVADEEPEVFLGCTKGDCR